MNDTLLVAVALGLPGLAVLWHRECLARAYPARRRAVYQSRIKQAETPGQIVTVAAEYLAANLQHMPDVKAARVVARAHADELTEAAEALHKYVPKKEVTR